jgi:hypothetical protein
MTIEIRQLIIRASVAARPEPERPATQSVTAATVDAPGSAESMPGTSISPRDPVVAVCVREVLRELKKARER